MRRKQAIINLFLFGLLMALAVVQVVIYNRDSTVGETYVSINNEVEKLEKTNNQMEQMIASASAITTISVRSQSFGFSFSPKIVSLTAPLPIAYGNRLSP